jgi:TRAP transporter TAXI family solute receptor
VKKGVIKKILVLLLVIFLISTTGCGKTEPAGEGQKEQPTQINLTFASGPSGGTWYPTGAAIGEIIQERVPGAVVTVLQGVTNANIIGINDRKYDMGLSLSNANYDARKGIGGFEKPMTEVRALMCLYSSPQQFAVRADSDIKTIRDFKGKSINTGVVGGATHVLDEVILKMYGMTLDDMGKVEHLGYADASSLMKDRNLDIFTAQITAPASAIQEVATTSGGVRLIPLDQDIVDKLMKENEGFIPYIIKAGTYKGQDEDCLAIGTQNTINIGAHIDDETAYKIAKALWEGRDKLGDVHAIMKDINLDNVAAGAGIPFHPGAEKFWREIGAIK